MNFIRNILLLSFSKINIIIMINKKQINQILTFLLTLSFILWLGIYISRLLITYQLFEPVDLSLKKIFINYDLNPIFYSFYPLIVSSLVLYLALLILFIFYLVTTERKVKENGWLLIITLIIFITSPFELYLCYKDLKLINTILEIPKVNFNEILSLVKERLIILNNFSLIEIFSYFIIAYLVIYKPLQKRQ